MKKLFLFSAIFFLMASPLAMANQDLFPDVKPDDWYAPYVYELRDKGILEGHPDGNFAPTEPVYRAELAKIISGLIHQQETKKDYRFEMIMIGVTVLGWIIIALVIHRVLKKTARFSQSVEPVRQKSNGDSVASEKNAKTNWWL